MHIKYEMYVFHIHTGTKKSNRSSQRKKKWQTFPSGLLWLQHSSNTFKLLFIFAKKVQQAARHRSPQKYNNRNIFHTLTHRFYDTPSELGGINPNQALSHSEVVWPIQISQRTHLIGNFRIHSKLKNNNNKKKGFNAVKGQILVRCRTLWFLTWSGAERPSCSCPLCLSDKTAAHSGGKTENKNSFREEQHAACEAFPVLDCYLNSLCGNSF